MHRARILGTGRYLPPRVVTNHDLEKLMDTSDEWIRQRSGIEERHFVDEGMGTADMGALAAREALRKAGLEPADLDCIVFATLSADYEFPGCGVFVQHALGAPTLPAIDIRNQCSGFLYSLSIADQFICTGMYQRILVIGSEIHSTGLDLTTRGRDVAVLFGDGAGAVVVGRSEDADRGILSTHLHSQGAFAKMLWAEAPGSIFHPRITHEMVDSTRIYPKMEGKKVFSHAVTRMKEVIVEALEANQKRVGDLSLLICHQANLRIIQFVASALEIPDEKTFNNIQKYGNTTAASIPIALDEAVEQGRLKAGDLLCLAAFGSGFTWASSLIRW